MPALFHVQAIGQSTVRNVHVVEGQDRISRDAPAQVTTFDESLWQVPSLAHLRRVHRFTVGHVMAVSVERLACFKVAFGDRTDFHGWSADRSACSIAEERNPRDRIWRFEVT